MREKLLYGIWASLYILCVGLGFVSEPSGLGKALLVLISLIFFVPGFLLLHSYMQNQNRKGIKRLRIICLCSLGLTLVFLVANFFSVLGSAATGKVLYDLLVLFSAPMICAQYWLLSLFLWACLLLSSILIKKK